MKVIDSYLDTMFANYPHTLPFTQARHDLQRMMEEQVDELISEGLTETQALGKVIAEFGSLDEVAEDLGLSKEISAYRSRQKHEYALKPEMPLERVQAYSNTVHAQAPRRSTGIALFILAPAALMFCLAIGGFGPREVNMVNFDPSHIASSTFESIMLATGLMLLLILVATGVFIYRSAETPLKKFVEVETGEYSLAPQTVTWIKQQTVDQKTQESRLRSAAIALFIISAAAVILPIILDAPEPFVLFGVGVLLVLVAAGVWLLNYKGSAIKTEEDLLLDEDDEDEDFFEFSASSSPLLKALGAFYWPILVAGFLLWGFVFDGWEDNWVLFPVGGLIYWALSEAAGAYEKNLDGQPIK